MQTDPIHQNYAGRNLCVCVCLTTISKIAILKTFYLQYYIMVAKASGLQLQ